MKMSIESQKLNPEQSEQNDHEKWLSDYYLKQAIRDLNYQLGIELTNNEYLRLREIVK